MNFRQAALIFALFVISACASNGRQAIPGVSSVGQMQVNIDEGWTIAPSSETPGSKATTRTYTREGLPLDRVTLVAGINDGESIFNSAGMAFNTAMQPEQLEELIRSSMSAFDGLNSATVSTSNRRSHGFAGVGGILMDTEAALGADAGYRGLAGAFVHEDRLYVMFYLAQEPDNFQRSLAAATAMIDSATVRVQTTGRF